MLSGFTRQELKEQLLSILYGGSPKMMQPPGQSMLKPSWQNMKAGGSKTPVEEIVGQFVGWRMEPGFQGAQNVVMSFNQCQILHSDTPHPYAEWDLNIKWSDSQQSGWGFFGVSLATALGIDIEMLDIDLMKGRYVHLLRTEHTYGPDKNTTPTPENPNPTMKGMVWRVVQFIQPGQTIQSVKGITQALASLPVTSTAPPAAIAPIAVAPVTTPVATVPVTVAVAPVVVPVAVVAAVNPNGALTPEQSALKLLGGRTPADFYQVAMTDENVKKDGTLLTSILSGAFIAAQIAGNRVVLMDDGTHTLTGA